MTIRKAMLSASANLSDVEHLITDPNLVLERKYDGTRALCVITPGSIQFLQRNGTPLKHTAATQHFLDLHLALAPVQEMLDPFEECVIDGEIMIDTGKYVLFDFPHFERVGVTVELPYLDRRYELERMFDEIDLADPIVLGGIAKSEDEKRALYMKVLTSGGEGVMAKRVWGEYEEGKRSKTSLKVKFVKTADVVVMDFYRGRDGKNAAGEPTGSETGWIKFGVCNDEGVLEPVGRCSIIGKPAVVVGEVIEVKYLYRGAGGALVQPTMNCVRPDRDPISCDYSQFPEYSKAID